VGSGLEGLAPLPPCGQLTRCFSAVAELLVSMRCNSTSRSRNCSACSTTSDVTRDITLPIWQPLGFYANTCCHLVSEHDTPAVIIVNIIIIIIISVQCSDCSINCCAMLTKAFRQCKYLSYRLFKYLPCAFTRADSRF